MGLAIPTRCHRRGRGHRFVAVYFSHCNSCSRSWSCKRKLAFSRSSCVMRSCVTSISSVATGAAIRVARDNMAIRVARDNMLPNPPVWSCSCLVTLPDSSMGAYALARLLTSGFCENCLRGLSPTRSAGVDPAAHPPRLSTAAANPAPAPHADEPRPIAARESIVSMARMIRSH
jgi:hypothetical protein